MAREAVNLSLQVAAPTDERHSQTTIKFNIPETRRLEVVIPGSEDRIAENLMSIQSWVIKAVSRGSSTVVKVCKKVVYLPRNSV